jgi:P-type conjugative transfer protein TrbJ
MKSAYVLAAVLAVACAQPAPAVVVECPLCSKEITGLMSYARQAEQLANEVSQLKTQMAQYSNMVTNTVSLPTQIWSDVSNTVSQVRGLANSASLLTGSSGGILNRMNAVSSFGYQAMSTPENITRQFGTWRQNTGNAASSLGKVLGVQQAQEQQYAVLQERIQQHSQSAEGQKQAIQAGNELLALTSTQLNQIQATISAQSQMLATQAINDADRQALYDYNLTQMTKKFEPVYNGRAW